MDPSVLNLKKNREKKYVVSDIYGNHSNEVNPPLKLLIGRRINECRSNDCQSYECRRITVGVMTVGVMTVGVPINNWDFFASE
jgi:hypothetical protein